MNLLHPIRPWRRAQSGLDEEWLDRDGAAWLASVAFHFLLLMLVSLPPAGDRRPRQELTLIVPQDLDAEPVELPQPPLIAVPEAPLPEIGAPRGDAQEPPMPQIRPLAPLAALAAAAGEGPAEPIPLLHAASVDGAALAQRLTGARGATVRAAGDIGSVERITQEILARLEDGPLLVVWLLDASESLRPRRQQILDRFDRVYEELGELVQGEAEPLLTSIAAFGAETAFLLPEPTADRAAIQQAVRRIAADASGIENAFAAVQAAALKYARFARSGRTVMLVVLTDEKGDDAEALDAALRLIRRHRMAVYVMGPAAPFGLEQIDVKWTDPDTNEQYLLPVDRGPETRRIEHARLALWKNGPGAGPLTSGFGPFGLSRLAQESGGLYLMQADGALAAPMFNPERLAPYRPDYLAAEDYDRLASDNPLRMAVLRVARAANARRQKPLPSVFLAAGIQFEIRDARQTLFETADTLERGLHELQAAETFRDREQSRRWVAHFDLLMGRLLAHRLRCASYGRLLEEMYRRPTAPDDGVHNAWEIAGAAAGASPATGGGAGEAEMNAALAQLQRVIDEHPDTPWAEIARQELRFPLAFQWRPAWIDPPAGTPLPWEKTPWDKLTAAQKTAKAAWDKRRAAPPQPQPPAAATRRLPPKL